MNRLTQLARQDADQLSPGFSEARHARIMHAVNTAQSRATEITAVQLAPPPLRLRSWLAPMALAAAVAGLAVSGVWLVERGQSEIAPHVAVQEPAGPATAKPQPTILALDQAAHQVNVHVQGVVETAMAQQQWAGLDQDVRAATRYFVDQVPLRSAWQDEGTRDER